MGKKNKYVKGNNDPQKENQGGGPSGSGQPADKNKKSGEEQKQKQQQPQGVAQPPGAKVQQQQSQGGQPQQSSGHQQRPTGAWGQQGSQPQSRGGYPQQSGGQQQRPSGGQQGSQPQSQGGHPQQSGGQQQRPSGGWGQQGSQPQSQGGHPQQSGGQQRQQSCDSRSSDSSSQPGRQQGRGRGGYQGVQQRGDRQEGQRGGYQGGQRGGYQGVQQRGDQPGGQRGGYQGGQRGGYQGGPQRGGGYEGKPQQGGNRGREPDTVVQLDPIIKGGPARGTKGKEFSVQTNYLTLDLKEMPDVAYHYDVKIDPDRPKKFLRPAFDAYVAKFFPKTPLAFDGKANAYSAELLSEQILNANQEAEVYVDERERKIPFKVTVKPTDDIEIDLKSLKTYQKDRIFDKPMRALQCIEVVLSLQCHKKGVRAGRSYFIKPEQKQDLGDGFELWLGLYQAAMLCNQPMLNVDVSHKSFPSDVNLVELYKGFYRGPQYALHDFLKGLRVTYTPPDCFKATPKDFKYIKVMSPSQSQEFKTDDGQKQTVAQYFASKGFKLKQPELPCLHVGSTIKNIYIPLELLSVPPGQAIMRKDNENQVRQMIRYAATSTEIRKEKIMSLLRFFDFYMHPTVQRFGISVGRQFITVPARLLQTPKIQYAGNTSMDIFRPGEWTMNNVNFLKCEKPPAGHRWAVLNISRNRDINAIMLKETLIRMVSITAGKLGMGLDQCSEIVEPPNADSGRYAKPAPISIIEDLNKLKQKKISIVFVILPPNASEAYAKVKQQAELKCGIVTQCIKGETIRSIRRGEVMTINQMTVSNILLKVNAKLNGTNHKIAAANEINVQKSNVMFVGADVSHPSPLQTNIPSIVGVVASHDLNGTQYNMQYRLQAPKLEEIEDMKDIFAQHLAMYKAKTNVYPDNIIYYRDGVSDGQFQKIERIELAAMRTACKAVKCDAKFTCIIVVKRHHTRFFPKGEYAEGKFSNVMAGTVVDQHIIHPNEVQFFMVSHKAIQGTSKPTRYNVIVDDAKINIDDLQALTYNLCHLFPRCNRSVSYPAPAYLAHLVGLRGRAYIEGSNLNLENLKAEYKKRCVSDYVMKTNPMYFV